MDSVVQAQAHLAMFELINDAMLERTPDASDTEDLNRQRVLVYLDIFTILI